MRIALAQIVSTAEPAQNLALVAERCGAAAAAGAPDRRCSPKRRCAASGCRCVRSPSRWTGGGRAGCAEIAAAAGITVVAGMFTPAADGRVHNTLLATGGGVEAGYDKIHLFDAFGFAESDTVATRYRAGDVELDG